MMQNTNGVSMLSILLAVLIILISFANGNPIVKRNGPGARDTNDDAIAAYTVPETDLWPWPTQSELTITLTDYGMPLNLSTVKNPYTAIPEPYVWSSVPINSKLPIMTELGGIPFDLLVETRAAYKPADVLSEPTPIAFKNNKHYTTPPKTTRAPRYPTRTAADI